MFKSLHHSWLQMSKSHSDAVGWDYIKETGISLPAFGCGGIVMARNRKKHSYCDVTTIRQTRRFRFWRRQISRWRRRWSRQTGRGPFLLSSFSIFQCMQYELPYVVIMYTHSTYRFVMVQRPVRQVGTFYARCMSMCVAYSTDYIQ